MLFLAGLQTVPEDLYESADIDGANTINKFIYITFPQIWHIVLLNTTIALMGAFAVFDLIFVMTNSGPYRSTEVIMTYMFTHTFGAGATNLGFGSAVSYLLFVIILVITLIQTKAMNRANRFL